MEGIAARSYIIMRENSDIYSFIPFVKEALFRELKRQRSTSQINAMFRRAGKHFAARGMIEDAIEITDNMIDRLPRGAPRRLRITTHPDMHEHSRLFDRLYVRKITVMRS